MSIFRRISNLFSRSRVNREIEDELKSHIEMRSADNISAGMPSEEARRDAAIRFGNASALKEHVMAADIALTFYRILADIRFAGRQLRRNPGFSVVVVFTLALGIGAVTAVYQVADEALFHPLPYRDANRIVMLWGNDRSKPDQRALLSANELREFSQSSIFDVIAGIDLKQLSFALTGAGKPRQISAAHVTPDFFKILGVPPLLGRSFRLNKHGESQDATAVISHALWKEHFHADPNVLGKSINLDGVAYTVVAVMPADFHFPIRYQDEDLQAWMPETLDPMIQDPVLRNAGTMLAFAKIPPGFSLQLEQQRLDAIHAQLLAHYPDVNQARVVGLYALNGELAGAHRTELFLLLGAVTVLLLIACTNVASLLLARGTARHQEMAVRVALGAGRRTLLQQLLTENILLACLGAFCALIVALIGVRVLSVYIQAQPGGYGFAHLLSTPSLGIATFHKSAFLFMTGILTITILLAGLAPALALSRADGLDAMKGQTRTSAAKQFTRWRSALLTGQISLSLVLAVGAMLLVRSFEKLVKVDPGFEVEHRLTYQLTLPAAKYPSDSVQARFFHNFLTKVETLPGVESAALIGGLPLTTWMKQGQFVPDTMSVSRAVEMPISQSRSVSTNYFSVMGIPFLSGHTFGEGTEENRPKEVVISQSLAKQYWPDTSAIGHHLKFDLDAKSPAYTIVGIVGDVRQNTLDKSTGAEYYVSYWNDSDRSMGLVVRTTVSGNSMQRAVQGALHAIDPDQPFAHVASFNQLVQEVARPQRTRFILLSIISGIALLLAAVGIFGLISYLVTQRAREIGIRLALGSGRGRVVLIVVKDAMKFVGLGISIGIVIALGLSSLMSNLLFGISAFDAVAYVASVVLLTALALAACILPAFRAASIDPAIALRAE